MAEPWPDCWERLYRCPVRGLPAPYTAAIDPAGRVLFAVNDTARKIACGRHRLCGICACALDGPVALLGLDPGGDPAQLVFSDGPMCPRCAVAALGACPFIAGERVPRRPPPAGFWLHAHASADPPKERWVLITATGYEMVDQPTRGGEIGVFFKPAGVLDVARYAYGDDRRLTELAVR